MRHELEKILGEELRILAIQTRDRLHLTQKEMGIRLHMSESSYSDIETGHSSCGALTEALLLEMQDNPGAFLHIVVSKFAEWYEEQMQPV
ncbi:MAG: helix-turn-helix domain-containing protein [Ruminococcaceae bacterium]|nr:helix-turn-helix domain-containing protein [Oscillospiraceae bacterium]